MYDGLLQKALSSVMPDLINPPMTTMTVKEQVAQDSSLVTQLFSRGIWLPFVTPQAEHQSPL